MKPGFDEKLTEAARLIQNAHYVISLTGAGISTPSGIPDFRSKKTGLWEKDDPMVVASLSAFLHRPMVFFNWLKPLAREIYYAKPNLAHQSLAKLEKNSKLKAIVTQNIDHLHQKAGSRNVIELHGSIASLECRHCDQIYEFEEKILIDFIENFEIPKCQYCHQYLKPSITLFEEMLPFDAWNKASMHFENADLVIVIGSSLEVFPANQLPGLALANGAKLLINTISKTPLDNRADILLPYDVIEIWPAILKKLDLLD